METLSRERFELAIRAVERPVDQGRLRIRFGDGDPADFRAGLARFRGDDGGYGHGIEPDVHLPATSPMATSVALHYLVGAHAGEDWPEVVGAIEYLVGSWDDALPGWEPVPPDVDEHPHAPWWQYRPPVGFPANPGAELVGYFCHFEELVPGPVLGEALSAAATALADVGPDVEAHEFLCWMRLARMASGTLARRIVERLRPAVASIVHDDPEAWDAYVPGPLWVAATPSSPFRDLVADRLDDHLDHLLGSQGADGAWHPSWTWGDDPAWPETAQVWRSPVTVAALETLDAWGRVERA